MRPRQIPFRSALILVGIFAALTVATAALAVVMISPQELRGDAPAETAGTGFDPERIYREASPAIAFVEVTSTEGERRTGSGFVVRDGHVLTNEHVVDGAQSVTVSFPGEREPRVSRVVGADKSGDLALLAVNDRTGLPEPLELGASTDLTPGAPIMVIGAPFGLELSASTGIVSALGRQITAPDGFAISNTIQTDAAVNPGNSGGPLLDDRGRVVGIATQIATGAGNQGNVGVAFAVPAELAKRNVDRWLSGRSVERAWLGIQGSDLDPDAAEREGIPSGVLISSVVEGSAAEKAGIEAGQVIVSLNGEAMESITRLQERVSAIEPGQTITLEVLDEGQASTVRVTLSARP